MKLFEPSDKLLIDPENESITLYFAGSFNNEQARKFITFKYPSIKLGNIIDVQCQNPIHFKPGFVIYEFIY